MNVWLKMIFSLSLSGTLMAIAYIILQKVFKSKLAPKTLYFVWLLVILRFVVPLSFENSFFNQSERFNTFENAPVAAVINAAFPILDPLNDYQAPSTISTPVVDDSNASTLAYTNETNVDGLKLSTLFTAVWLIGAILYFTYHWYTYLRYMRHLKTRLIEPTSDMYALYNQVKISFGLTHRQVNLAIDPLGETPMLVGLFHSKVILPEETSDLEPATLRAIFSHELTHYKRNDLWIKWLTVFVASVHWFNPFMPWIQNEVNRACELSCDAQVIKSMGLDERRHYGALLLNTVRSPKHRIQAALYEDQKTMKKRLTQIVKPVKGSVKTTLLVTLILLLMALILGVFLGNNDKLPPELYVFPEGGAHKTAQLSSYNWSYDSLFEEVKLSASALHPTELLYEKQNILFGEIEQQLFIGTQVLNNDPTFDIKVEAIEIYREGENTPFLFPDTHLSLDGIYTNLPSEKGNYIYLLQLTFDDRGPVTYGFKVVIGMPEYALDKIEDARTDFVGDASKVGVLLSALPAPDPLYNQRFMSILSSETPYALTAYYEPTALVSGAVSFEINDLNRYEVEHTRKKNALVLFYGIKNVDVIHFSYRPTASQNELEMDAYTEHFTYTRDEITDYFGGIPKTIEGLSSLVYQMP